MIDEKGEAVIGATVLVKGTTNGTITDVDGIFTLDNVPEDLLLVEITMVKVLHVNMQPLFLII